MKLISGGSDRAANNRNRRPKKRRRGLRIVLSMLIILALAVGVYAIWERPPEQHTGGLYTPVIVTVPPPAVTQQPEISAPAPPTPPVNTRNEDAYTFLLVGTDKVGSNTDTIMLGCLDAAEHSLNVISIPRDTLVNTPHSIKKINSLYAYDLNEGGNGIDGLMDGAADMLGFSPDFYAVVDLSAFVKLVDAIGGVWYTVPVDMYYEDPFQDLSIAIPAGYQWLSGEDALKVVRFRSGYASADIGRIGTQQDFLKSVAKQVLTLGNIPNLPNIIKIFEDNVKTDLTADELSFLARQFLLCKSEDIAFHTMPGNYNDYIGGFSYVSVYIRQWLAMVNEWINPWSEPVTERNVNILTHEDGVFYSTTGRIEGGQGSFLTMEEYLAGLG